MNDYCYIRIWNGAAGETNSFLSEETYIGPSQAGYFYRELTTSLKGNRDSWSGPFSPFNGRDVRSAYIEVVKADGEVLQSTTISNPEHAANQPSNVTTVSRGVARPEAFIPILK